MAGVKGSLAGPLHPPFFKLATGPRNDSSGGTIHAGNAARGAAPAHRRCSTREPLLGSRVLGEPVIAPLYGTADQSDRKEKAHHQLGAAEP